MSTIELVCGSALLIFAIAIISVVLLQEGHQKNVGAITGTADTFFEKNKSRSMDSFLARCTKIIAFMLFVLIVVMNIVVCKK